jgi:glycosyltransferase involved in cell wall biosynthesis
MAVVEGCGITRMKASVVIRTYNEARLIGAVLQSLRSQSEYGQSMDIVGVDSGSTDGTVDIMSRYGVTLIGIAGTEFNYSRALNLGIERTRGDVILILSGHAVPLSEDWVIRMVRHMDRHDTAGVYCRQRPWPGADLHETLRLDRMFGRESVQFTSDSSDMDRMHFSNAASCIRRSVWQEHPFVEMPAAEDREWAAWAMKHGYTIAYDAEAKVYHSHAESCRQAAKRVIELERAADLAHGRTRTAVLTARQSAGMLVRDLRETAAARASGRHKLAAAVRSLGKCFWYVADFSTNKGQKHQSQKHPCVAVATASRQGLVE